MKSFECKYRTKNLKTQQHFLYFTGYSDKKIACTFKIVIPNIAVREVDIEQFEDDPAEYILSDMEGSDSETRRRCSINLLRAMCRQFEAQTTAIVLEHLASLLDNYARDQTNNWGQKDAAILLVLAVSVRKESNVGGVTEMNDKMNVIDFFTLHILPELQEQNMALRPMLKADAVKFVSTFRNQFSTEQYLALFPLLINHLSSDSVVVHTYAAACVEKVLTVKTERNGKQLKFGRAELKRKEGLLEALFGGL